VGTEEQDEITKTGNTTSHLSSAQNQQDITNTSSDMTGGTAVGASYKVETRRFCCDRKSRAACAKSFALWQQVTIEITCHDHSIIACSLHQYMSVILRALPVCGE